MSLISEYELEVWNGERLFVIFRGERYPVVRGTVDAPVPVRIWLRPQP